MLLLNKKGLNTSCIDASILFRLSPVITKVGGASPQPTIPFSHVIFTYTESAMVTVRNAV